MAEASRQPAKQPSPLFNQALSAVQQADALESVCDGFGTKKAADAGNIGCLRVGQEAVLSPNSNADVTQNQADTLRAALKYLQVGLSVIPIQPSSKKAAVSWKIYQERRMTEEEAKQLFLDERQVAIVGGAISSNVECADFDAKASEIFPTFLETLQAVNPALREKLTIWQNTPSDGYHILYRCSGPVDGSQKLAESEAYLHEGEKEDRSDTFIETRGEGGYFLIEPSRAVSKLDGQIKPYMLHGDIGNLPVLTPQERGTLLTIARTFDERPATPPPEMQPFVSAKPDGKRAGDILEREGDWHELLTEAGWKPVGGTKLREHWQRPGKKDNSVSATLNEQGLFVFSTNAGLPVGQPINKFAFIAFAEYGGNFQAAAKALGEKYSVTGDLDEAEIEAEIERLAGLSKYAYARQRETAKKKLKMGVQAIDKLVAERRAEIEGIRAMGFAEVEPSPEPQDAAALMGDIYQAIKRHIVCEDAAAIAATLWIMMTWLADVVDCAPIALIAGPEKRCGKSQFLAIMSRLVHRPLASSGISPAAVFRVVEQFRPTLLIDEADACMKDNEALRGVINSGHTRDSAKVIRCEGDNHVVRTFNTFGPKAIAGIGTPAETIVDRSIILELRRRKDNEPVARLDETDPESWAALRSRLRRFSDDNREKVQAARPMLPDALNDRERDNWRPLLAIAELADAATVKAVCDAALTISGNANRGEESAQVQLLRSMRGLFKETGCARLGSKQLVALLKQDGQSLWPTFDHGKPVNERQVATLLKHFKIEARRFRDSSGVQYRGYLAEDFQEAFARYLAPQQPDEYVADGTPFVPIGRAPAGFDFAAVIASLGGKAIQ
ncbi:MAG: DUF3631 domain-containing protein [Desulfobulbaceae bacterium]|jgi:hypothetical protein|nr:DUF3631 domain-containing protein [Desulfobulbaceae bacterium]